MMKGLRAFALGLAALAVVACGPLAAIGSAPTPAAVAERTKLDEQVGISLTTAYTAVSKAAGLAIETGFIKNTATITRLGKLDRAAYDAVMAVRQAYLAANSTSYLEAIQKANAAIRAFYDAITSARSAAAVDTEPAHAYQAVLFYERAEKAVASLPPSGS